MNRTNEAIRRRLHLLVAVCLALSAVGCTTGARAPTHRREWRVGARTGIGLSGYACRNVALGDLAAVGTPTD